MGIPSLADGWHLLWHFSESAALHTIRSAYANNSMQLIRANEVPETPRDLVFRASRLHAVIFVVVCLVACAYLISTGWPHPPLGYYIGGFILLCLLLARRMIAARFHPLNWLVRLSDDSLYIHFRSYLNEHLSADDPTVIFLNFSDIRSARLVRETVTKRDMNNRPTTEFVHWIELELAVDPAPIVAALADERARPAALEKRWYGTSGTLYLDYPVLIETPPFLRIKWQVVPRASEFLEVLRQRVPIDPEIHLRADFSNLQNLPPDQQKKRLSLLADRGDKMTAVYLARKLHRCDLTEATRIVDSLSKGSQS